MKLKIGALMTVAALGLAACGGSSYNKSASSSSSSTTKSASGSTGGAYGGGGGGGSTNKTTSSSSGSTSIQMHDNFFGTKTITGKAGSTVKVSLSNVGSNEHNFKIVGQKANADVKPGKSATVSVVIPKSGSVQFYCEYHKGLGMVGTVKPS